ncbi:hypothetical protein HY78_24230 [Rhizorhabdus wittichii DC-6]|nr:hypothetical protein HY78_24230 [Rhizorhabdus wittichii DC-6]
MRDAIPVDRIAMVQQAQARALKATGNALDIATDGGGTLLFRVGDVFRTASSAQLHRDADGRLVDSAGGALQAAGGGDLVVDSGTPTILRDGTILVEGQAVGRIGVFDAVSSEDDMISLLPDTIEDAVVHQGYLTPSEVDSATEMVELTKAGRLAETGARMFQIYDDLSGRVASKLGELAR